MLLGLMSVRLLESLDLQNSPAIELRCPSKFARSFGKVLRLFFVGGMIVTCARVAVARMHSA